MFDTIMTPVDLAHTDALDKALQCCGAMAQQSDAKVVFVGVTAAAPGAVAHNPDEYAQKLADFAQEQAEQHGFSATALPKVTHDPRADLDQTLLQAAKECDADLVVMASHLPNVADHIWPSHGGKIAASAQCSVFVVRP